MTRRGKHSGPWPGRFVWVDLMTREGARADAFYSALFGWSIEQRTVHGYLYREVTAGPGPIGGIIDEPDVPMAQWLPYVAVADVDVAVAKCRELGGSVTRKSAEHPHGGRCAVLADAEKAEFAVYCGDPGHPGADPELTTAGRVCWNELWAKDGEEACRFYGELFGWRTQGMPMEPQGTYHLQLLGEHLAAGITQNPNPDSVARWITYFQVDDLAVSTQRALQLRAKKRAGPIDLPGIGTFTLITDPLGATLALFQPPALAA